MGDVKDHVRAHREPAGIAVENRDRANELTAPVGVPLHLPQEREARRHGGADDGAGPTIDMLHRDGLSGGLPDT